jgi:hypothetical protein
MADAKDGASVGVVALRPSIDLATPLQIAAKHLDGTSGATGHEATPFISGHADFATEGKKAVDGAVIHVDTAGVLRRMASDPDFAALSSSGTSFLRDVAPPKANVTVKVGGRMCDGTEAALKRAVKAVSEHVRSGVREAIERINQQRAAFARKHNLPAPVNVTPSLFLLDPQYLPRRLMDVASGIGVKLQTKAKFELQGITFSETDKAGRADEIARQMTSYEEVQGGRRIDAFLDSVRQFFVSRDEDETDVDLDIRTWRENAQPHGSDMQRFMNFLDDEGLSRVRLGVSFRIMQVLVKAAEGDESKEAFRHYATRVSALHALVVERGDDDIRVDLSRLFTADANFLMSDELSKAATYGFLPVWALWDTQLFESRPEDMADSGVRREVCYYFKVNGHNPVEDKPAYDARIDLCIGALADGHRDVKSLTELLLLDAVVPGGEFSGLDPVSAIKARVAKLSSCRTRDDALAMLRDTLESRASEMRDVAEQMVETLRTKAVDATMQRLVRQEMMFFVNVKSTVLNKNAVDGNVLHPLAVGAAAPDGDKERMSWLKCIHVSEGAPQIGHGNLFSFHVTVQLGDRSARRNGNLVTGTAERLLDDRVATVAMVPYHDDGGRSAPEPTDAMAKLSKLWRAHGFSLVVTYDPSQLAKPPRQRNGGTDKTPDENRMAAMRATFAMLVQIAMETIMEEVAADAGGWKGRVIFNRYADKGKESQWDDGEYAAYAVSQALEHVLGKHLPVKLQGMSALPDTGGWRKKKCFDATMSGFDLAVSYDDKRTLSMPKVGTIFFASRPCDITENAPSCSDDRHVLLGRCYVAVATPEGFVLRRQPNIADVYQGSDVLNNPSIIHEAVKRLVDEGCRHVLVVSHMFSGRSIGRSAMRHRHHDNPEFLASLRSKFPGVIFFPMVRDTMKVVRTGTEAASRIGFEVVGKDDHLLRYVNDAMRNDFWRRGLTPVYSLATLVNVRASTGQRPQSAFCCYYLLGAEGMEAGDSAIASMSALVSASPEQAAVVDVLRAVHLMESEEGAMKGQFRPVLDPASWMSPNTIGGAGEFKVMTRRRRASGEVTMNAVAVMSTVSGMIRTLRAVPRRQEEPADGEG